MIYDYVQTDLAGTLILAGDENGLRHLNFIQRETSGVHPRELAAGHGPFQNG